LRRGTLFHSKSKKKIKGPRNKPIGKLQETNHRREKGGRGTKKKKKGSDGNSIVLSGEGTQATGGKRALSWNESPKKSRGETGWGG